jgi:hypothetical protein
LNAGVVVRVVCVVVGRAVVVDASVVLVVVVVVAEVRGTNPVELISVMKIKYAMMARIIPTKGRAMCQ